MTSATIAPIGPTLPTLPELIDETEYWFAARDSSGQLTGLIAEIDFPLMRDQLVPLSEFIALDPRFEELVTLLYQDNTKRFHGIELDLAYQGWCYDLLELPIRFLPAAYQASDQPATFKVSALEPVYTKMDNGDIQLQASLYIPDTLPSGTAYARTMTTDVVTLTRGWLQQHVPDWENKFRVAQGMGLEVKMIPNYVFGESPPSLAAGLPTTESMLNG